jgi:hypothetical protein
MAIIIILWISVQVEEARRLDRRPGSFREQAVQIKVNPQLSIHLASSRKLPSSRFSLHLNFKGAYSCSPINMSAENAVAAASSLPVKPEGPFGRPSMFHSSKQFIEAGDLVILHQVSFPIY